MPVRRVRLDGLESMPGERNDVDGRYYRRHRIGLLDPLERERHLAAIIAPEIGNLIRAARRPFLVDRQPDLIALARQDRELVLLDIYGRALIRDQRISLGREFDAVGVGDATRRIGAG